MRQGLCVYLGSEVRIASTAVFMETGGEMGAKSSRPGDFKAVVDGVDAHDLESVLQQQTQRFRGVAMPAMPRIQHDAHVVPILPGHGVYVDLTKERAVTGDIGVEAFWLPVDEIPVPAGQSSSGKSMQPVSGS